MTAELHYAKGDKPTKFVKVPADLLPAHIYCDTCGDCLICDMHDVEPWCATGGRWVLYDDTDADLFAKILATVTPCASVE